VITGAVVTGGIQAVGSISARRLNSRTAARVMCVSLLEAAVVCRVILKHQWWGPARDDLGRLLRPWDTNRDALLRVLSADESLALAGAFTSLERMKALKEAEQQGLADPDEPPEDEDFSENADSLRGTLDLVIAAGNIAWRAGYPALRKPSAEKSPFAPFVAFLQVPEGSQEPPEDG
jgi:hypothetical protein